MGDFWERSDSEIKEEDFTSISSNVLNHEIHIKHETDDSKNILENIHEWNANYKEEATIKTENVTDLYSTSLIVDCGNGYIDEQLNLKGQVSFGNDPDDLQCRICEYKTKREQLLARHFLMKHEIVVWFQCQLCEYRSQLVRNLKHHLYYKHNENVKCYTCHSCEYKTQSVTRLRAHVKCKHNANNVWLQCDFCGYKAKKISTFRKHVKYKHDNKFKCDGYKLCEYKTKPSSYLREHHKNKQLQNLEENRHGMCDYKTAEDIDHIIESREITVGGKPEVAEKVHDQDAERNHSVISDYKAKIIKNYETKIKIRLIKQDCYGESNKQTTILPVKLGENVTHKRENLIDVRVYEGNVKSKEIDIAEQYAEDINHVESRKITGENNPEVDEKV